MKLKAALKKFNFISKLDLPEDALAKVANQLVKTLTGDNQVHMTPLGESQDVRVTLAEFDQIFKSQSHKMNAILHRMEDASRNKYGPRSIAIPWSERIDGLRASFHCQKDNRDFKWTAPDTLPEYKLSPVSVLEAATHMKDNSSAGLPSLKKKGKEKDNLLKNFDKILEREDPCMLYTRTTEAKKTRNVWGYPFADTLYEFMFFIPYLNHCKKQFYHASLTSIQNVEERITKLVLKAIDEDLIIYSVDFASFDASVWFQFIIASFEFMADHFLEVFRPFIMKICLRFYTIAIVTPTGIYRGKHGVPSGSTFTNLIDCDVQLGLALNCFFINANECLVNGDDGLYIMKRENIKEFEQNFLMHGLKLELTKSDKASDYAVFCQRLYHIDYISDDGVIHGVYPVYRALNRLLFQERFVNFKKNGISGKDYYGIRAVSILEDCKNHPLHEDLVRFVLKKEKYNMDISDDSIALYCKHTYVKPGADVLENSSELGDDTKGIRNYETMKLIRRILQEEASII